MVATPFKLKIDPADPQSAGRLADYYTKYYTESGGTAGQWFGRGAESLGLTDQQVTRGALRNLFLGKSLDGRQQLMNVRIPKPEAAPQDGEGVVADEKAETQKKAPELHVPAIDVTFSVPKAVSALWATGDERVVQIIEAAVDECVRERLSWLENEVELARRGKGGCDKQSAGLVVATFDHSTARNSNHPQLHRHCVIINACHGDEDDRWGKVNSRLLLSWIRTQGPLFRNSLLHKLTERLGVEGYCPMDNGKRVDWFELKGIPQPLLKHWSSRRGEILRETEMLPGVRSSVKARQNANLRTRRMKGSQLDDATLREKWRQDADRFSFTHSVAQSVLGRKQSVDVEQRVSQAITVAAEKCTTDQAYFTRQKFIQRVSEELQDVAIAGPEVLKRAEAALKTEHFRSVKHDQSETLAYTTKSMWELEKKMLADIDALQSTNGAKVSKRTIEQTLKKHRDLSPEQSNAAKALLKNNSSLRRMTGVSTKELSQEQLTLGYAATTHKMQGQSVRKAYRLLGGGMTNKELAYVQLTRGEESTELFIDRHHAGQKLADIADAMKQSGKKYLAHDIADDNRRRLRIERAGKES